MSVQKRFKQAKGLAGQSAPRNPATTEAGWSLPFVPIFFVVIPAAVILFLWGWRRLWLVPVIVLAVVAFTVVVDLVERGKNPSEDPPGPVPQLPADYCPRCQRPAEIVDRGGGIFGVRCPHCGHQEG